MPERIYDWIQIKNDYFNSEIESAIPFIRQYLGIDKEAQIDGNIQKHISGWPEEKQRWKKDKIKRAQDQADRELMEQLKIPVKKLLENKRLLFELDSSYIFIYGKKNAGQKLTDDETEFFNMYKETGMIKGIYERMQNELGLVSDRKGFENTGQGDVDWDKKMDEEYDEFIRWRKTKL